MISFIVPAFNEENYIIRTIQSINHACSDLIDFEIVVVDDCSTDDTVKILLEYNKNSSAKIEIVKHEVNQGNAQTVVSGVLKANFEYIFLLPGDFTYGDMEIRKVLLTFRGLCVAESLYPDVIIGERVSDSRGIIRELLVLMSRFFIFLLSPTKDFIPNIGLILTKKKFLYPITPAFPRNFYHLGLMLNWRINRARIYSAGKVFQNSGSGLRSRKLKISQVFIDCLAFLKFSYYFYLNRHEQT
jgi:glycosyltransferase involved in cell wall biosynthesis